MPSRVNFRGTIEERFWAKVLPEPNSGCWLWGAGLSPEGYGRLSESGTRKALYAHRYSYELHKGPIPEGLELDHLCRVRSCVNPDHLEPVTRKTNMLRGLGNGNKEKTHCPKGHLYSGQNLIISTRGNGKTFRRCRTCLNKQNAEYMREKRRGARC